MDKNLAKAIVDIAVFLEFSDADVVNEDSAVAMLEKIASDLQCMERAEQESLALNFTELAGQYGDRREFVERLSNTLGLA